MATHTQARHAWLTARAKVRSAETVMMANGAKVTLKEGRPLGEKMHGRRRMTANQRRRARYTYVGLAIRKGMIIDKARLESNSNADSGTMYADPFRKV